MSTKNIGASWRRFRDLGLCVLVMQMCSTASMAADPSVRSNQDARIKTAYQAFVSAMCALDESRARELCADPEEEECNGTLEYLKETREAYSAWHSPSMSQCYWLSGMVYRTSMSSDMWVAEAVMTDWAIDSMSLTNLFIFTFVEKNGQLKFDALEDLLLNAVKIARVSSADTMEEGLEMRAAWTAFNAALVGVDASALSKALAAADGEVRNRIMESWEAAHAKGTGLAVQYLTRRWIGDGFLIPALVTPGTTPETRDSGEILPLCFKRVDGVLKLVALSPLLDQARDQWVTKRAKVVDKRRVQAHEE